MPDASAETYPELDALIGHALAYHRDFVAPTLKRRAPEGVEIEALQRAGHRLSEIAILVRASFQMRV